MTWYEHLYVGEKAQKQRFSVIQKLRERKAGYLFGSGVFRLGRTGSPDRK